jgi:hypothetical protein
VTCVVTDDANQVMPGFKFNETKVRNKVTITYTFIPDMHDVHFLTEGFREGEFDPIGNTSVIDGGKINEPGRNIGEVKLNTGRRGTISIEAKLGDQKIDNFDFSKTISSEKKETVVITYKFTPYKHNVQWEFENYSSPVDENSLKKVIYDGEIIVDPNIAVGIGVPIAGGSKGTVERKVYVNGEEKKF